MADVHTLLAQNVKKYRQILGISQAELAERVNCSLTLIGNIEIKKRFPSSKNLDLLAQALGVKPADLFAEGIPQKRGALADETGGTQLLPNAMKAEIKDEISSAITGILSRY